MILDTPPPPPPPPPTHFYINFFFFFFLKKIFYPPPPPPPPKYHPEGHHDAHQKIDLVIKCFKLRAVPEMTKWGGRAAIDFFLCGWSYFFNIYFVRGWAVEKKIFVGHWSILIFFLCNAGI